MKQAINGTIRRLPAWPVYIVSFLYAAWLFWLGISDRLGADPVAVLEHRLGEAALQLYIVSLAITPLRKFAGVSFLKFRRAIGLSVFFLVAVHLGVWMFLDVQIWGQIWGDILKRPYITVGMIGFLLMVPLAVTSNNWSIRKLGSRSWNALHRLTYAAILLGAIHNVMVQKVWEAEPLVYLVVIIGLLAMRIRVRFPNFTPKRT